MAVSESLLKKHPFFKNLHSWYVEQLSRYGDAITVDKGHYVFKQGQKADQFYLILSGKINLEIYSSGGDVLIQTLGPGEILGWSWLVAPYKWRFDAKAVGKTKLIGLHGKYLRSKSDEDHTLGYELMKRLNVVILDRLQSTRNKLIKKQKADSSKKAVPARAKKKKRRA